MVRIGRLGPARHAGMPTPRQRLDAHHIASMEKGVLRKLDIGPTHMTRLPDGTLEKVDHEPDASRMRCVHMCGIALTERIALDRKKHAAFPARFLVVDDLQCARGHDRSTAASNRHHQLVAKFLPFREDTALEQRHTEANHTAHTQIRGSGIRVAGSRGRQRHSIHPTGKAHTPRVRVEVHHRHLATEGGNAGLENGLGDHVLVGGVLADILIGTRCLSSCDLDRSHHRIGTTALATVRATK